MRKIVTTGLLFIALCLLVTFTLDARGGRGGGRGGGGRSVRSGSVNRGPSMSRSTSKSRPKQQKKTQRTPKRQTPPSAQRPSQRQARDRDVGRGRDTPSRNQVNDFFKQQGQTPSRDSLGERRPQSDRDRQSRQDRRDNRQEVGGNIRGQIKDNRPNSRDWFQGDFWDKHPNHHDHFRNGNWRRPATWAAATGWLGWGYADPYYYYDDGYYYGDEEVADDYAAYTEPTQDIADVSEEDLSAQDWLSLGVFAFSQDKAGKASPNIFVQLALSKDGLLSGTYYNATTDETYPVEGLVDKESQRAAWKVTGSDYTPIIETALYNLTENESTARLNFTDGRTQDVYMIRMEDKEG